MEPQNHVLARIEQQPRARYTRNLYVGPAPPEDDEDADWVPDYNLTVQDVEDEPPTRLEGEGYREYKNRLNPYWDPPLGKRDETDAA